MRLTSLPSPVSPSLVSPSPVSRLPTAPEIVRTLIPNCHQKSGQARLTGCRMRKNQGFLHCYRWLGQMARSLLMIFADVV